MVVRDAPSTAPAPCHGQGRRTRGGPPRPSPSNGLFLEEFSFLVDPAGIFAPHRAPSLRGKLGHDLDEADDRGIQQGQILGGNPVLFVSQAAGWICLGSRWATPMGSLAQGETGFILDIEQGSSEQAAAIRKLNL